VDHQWRPALLPGEEQRSVMFVEKNAPLEIIHLPGRDETMNSLFVPAIRVGNTVYLSGIAGAPTYHNHPHRAEDFAHMPDDPEQQAYLLFEAMKKTLHAAGTDFDRIVYATRFLVNIERDQDILNRVQREYLGDHLPTSATVGVTKLAMPMLFFEIQAIAVL
jgi:enamine deaminase RidA (YjgF/YER057c/UK114 family)